MTLVEKILQEEFCCLTARLAIQGKIRELGEVDGNIVGKVVFVKLRVFVSCR